MVDDGRLNRAGVLAMSSPILDASISDLMGSKWLGRGLAIAIGVGSIFGDSEKVCVELGKGPEVVSRLAKARFTASVLHETAHAMARKRSSGVANYPRVATVPS